MHLNFKTGIRLRDGCDMCLGKETLVAWDVGSCVEILFGWKEAEVPLSPSPQAASIGNSP